MKFHKHHLLKVMGIALLCFNSASVSAAMLTSGRNIVSFADSHIPRQVPDTEAAGRIQISSSGSLSLSTDEDHDASDIESSPIPTGESVFEDVGLFHGRKFFTELFRIDAPGTYQATLTDFVFPNPLKRVGMNITTATESLGMLTEPGFFTFDAKPGNYFVSFFGKAHHLGQYGIDISRTGSPVPVPAAVWLFGSGLMGLVGVVRRKTVI